MRRRQRTTAIAVAVVMATGALGYAVYTSTGSDNPCATSGLSTAVSPVRPTISGLQAGGDPLAAGVGAASPRALDPSGVIHVVAAENFWGSLVGQLGGNLTSVLSIVTDPNADPHEYEANSSDAAAMAGAQLVIVNGVGYDDWATRLAAADNNPSQILLNVGELNGVNLGGGILRGNPQVWYSPAYVNRTVAAMYSDLVQIQPNSRGVLSTNFAALNSSLGELYGRATAIKGSYAGVDVAATEDIFVYLANFTGLDLVSPPAFMQAVGEGNDPPASTVAQFQCQLESGLVRVLVYNLQTVTPITAQMVALADAQHVPVVGITETIQPPGISFQAWMGAEYLALQDALSPPSSGVVP